MSFDGAVEDLIAAWASAVLPPRKRRQDSVSVAVVPMGGDGELRVLYSYAEAIAAMYVTMHDDAEVSSRFVVVKQGKEALERASMTTKKHLRWAQHQLREELKYGRFEPLNALVFLYRGNVPTNPADWFNFGNYIAVVRQVPDETAAELWRAYQREPWDEGIWNVLRDYYAERGFGERYGALGSQVQLRADGAAFELYGAATWLQVPGRGRDAPPDALVR